MRMHQNFFLFLAIILSRLATSQELIPPVSNVGEGALVEARQIFTLSKRPTSSCHASTIVETRGGLVAAWFGGTHEGHRDVGILTSRYKNGKWSVPVEVVNGVQSSTKRYPCWNPVLFQPENGPLILFYKVGPSPSSWWGMMTTSTDHGKTWSWPTKLGENPLIGHLLGPVKNKPLELQDGSILCPSSSEK